MPLLFRKRIRRLKPPPPAKTPSPQRRASLLQTPPPDIGPRIDTCESISSGSGVSLATVWDLNSLTESDGSISNEDVNSSEDNISVGTVTIKELDCLEDRFQDREVQVQFHDDVAQEFKKQILDLEKRNEELKVTLLNLERSEQSAQEVVLNLRREIIHLSQENTRLHESLQAHVNKIIEWEQADLTNKNIIASLEEKLCHFEAQQQYQEQQYHQQLEHKQELQNGYMDDMLAYSQFPVAYGPLGAAGPGLADYSYALPQIPATPRKDANQRHHLPVMHYPVVQQIAGKKKIRQCFKCQKFGHDAKHCNGETACLVCSELGHTHKECTSNETRCVNCQGAHRATSKSCPARLAWSSSTRNPEPQVEA